MRGAVKGERFHCMPITNRIQEEYRELIGRSVDTHLDVVIDRAVLMVLLLWYNHSGSLPGSNELTINALKVK